MKSGAEEAAGATQRDQFEKELHRVIERCAALSLDRLSHPAPPWPSRSEAIWQTSRALASLVSSTSADRLPRHINPVDLLSVAGHDALLHSLELVDEKKRDQALLGGTEHLISLRQALK